MKRKLIFISCVLLAFSPLFSGCQNASETESSEIPHTNSEPVEITFATWGDEQIYMDAIAQAYELNHPNVKVNVTYMEEYSDDIFADYLRENPQVDLMGIKDINSLHSLSREGVIQDITQMISDSDLEIKKYGNLYKEIRINNADYCLPTRNTCWILFYNRDIFDDEGLPYPEQMTWEEYAELALSLTTQVNGEKRWGGHYSNWMYNFVGVQNRNYLYDDDISYCIQSLAWMNRFYNVDKSHPDIDEMALIDKREYFETGKIAMILQGEWFIGELIADERAGKEIANWDIAPMPISKGQQEATTWGLYHQIVMSAFSQHKEAAFDFMKFLCSSDGAKLYAANAMLPAYNTPEVWTVYDNAIGNRNLEVLMNAHRISERPVYEEYQTLEQLFEKEALQYLHQTETLEEAENNFLAARKLFFSNSESFH